jgi:alcohol dehydrogenase (cytochrome c)
VDATDEQVLADIAIEGQTRKVMIQANKNGFLYVLDRTNCKPIAANAMTKINWASGISKETNRPILTGVYKDFLAGEEVQIFPSRGTNATPIAFNPNTGLVYANTWNVARIQKLAASNPQALGSVSTGVTARNPPVNMAEAAGAFVALNPLTGEKKWESPLMGIPSAAGMLATDGGLIFTGKATGEVVALDADTGNTLWQFKVSSSVNATPITFTHNGKQYVSIASGLGGAVVTRFVQATVPTGGSLWTFALMPE